MEPPLKKSELISSFKGNYLLPRTIVLIATHCISWQRNLRMMSLHYWVLNILSVPSIIDENQTRSSILTFCYHIFIVLLKTFHWFIFFFYSNCNCWGFEFNDNGLHNSQKINWNTVNFKTKLLNFYLSLIYLNIECCATQYIIDPWNYEKRIGLEYNRVQYKNVLFFTSL